VHYPERGLGAAFSAGGSSPMILGVVPKPWRAGWGRGMAIPMVSSRPRAILRAFVMAVWLRIGLND